MLLGQTLIRFTQLGVKIFDLLAQPGKSFLGFVTSAAGLPSLTYSRTIRDDQNQL